MDDKHLNAAVDDFLDALGQGDIQRLSVYMVCPNCGAEHPIFHSPVGTLETLCDDCGWSSDENNRRYDPV